LKKYLLISYLLFISFILYANEYSDKWPFINDNNVNCRDFPDQKIGKINFQGNKGQSIVIQYKTTEKYMINGYENFWYYVSIFDGVFQNNKCWIFGKYISYKDSFDEVFWDNTIFKIKKIDQKDVYKNILAKQIFKYLDLDTPNNKSDAIILKKFKKTDNQKSNLWYMLESGYIDANTYRTDIGYLLVYYNEKENLYKFLDLLIDKNIPDFPLKIGSTISEIESIIGNNYTLKDNIMEFNFNEDFDTLYWTIDLKNNKLEKIDIEWAYH